MMKQYLNIDLICMHMFATFAITPEDYDKLNVLKQSNATRAEICIAIARIIAQRHTLNEFITALENSQDQDRGHETIVRIIKEEQEKEVRSLSMDEANPTRKISDPNTEQITLIPHIIDQMPKLDCYEPGPDDQRDGAYYPPRERLGSSQTGDVDPVVRPNDELPKIEVSTGLPFRLHCNDKLLDHQP